MEEPRRSSGSHVDERGIRPPPAFAIEPLPAPEGVLLLRLEGELDLAAAGGFRDRIADALALGARSVVVDMHDTQFIDSSMLKELLRAHATLDEAGGRLVLTGPAPPVQRLFELTRVGELLNIAPSRDAAIELASRGAAPG
jgi:stage II sporulation protein AA (anti-sigma F factor antagonist)